MLEVNIRVFCSAADFRSIRIEGTITESFNSVPIDQFAEVVEVHYFNFLDFVGCTEAIEEVDERKGTFKSGQVSNTSQVHNFLNVGFCQETAAGSTSRHNVLVVAEDAQCMVSQCTGSNMEYTREHFAGNFVHVRDHEQEALGSRICSGQSTSL